jgi:hypothetical protein
MTKTCVERVQSIEHINVYRAIVAAITAELTEVGGTTGAYYMTSFPDPVEYAAKIDTFAARFGDGPVNIAEATELLGPNSGQDRRNMSALYNGLRADLNMALKELDRYWEGDAADQFVGSYMSGLCRHLDDLAAACEEQNEAGIDISDRIVEAQADLVNIVREMVRTVITYATLGPAVEAIGLGGTTLIAGGAAAITVETAGIGAVIIAATVTGTIIYQLVEYHKSMTTMISKFNSELGSKLTHAVNGIEFRSLDLHVDGNASKVGWRASDGIV